MHNNRYKLTVKAEDQANAGRGANALIDILREADGVIEVDRSKSDNQTMDLGTIVSVVATSGATLAIAQGLAAWLKARRDVVIDIEKDKNSGSIKASVSGIDPKTAERIIEMVRDG